MHFEAFLQACLSFLPANLSPSGEVWQWAIIAFVLGTLEIVTNTFFLLMWAGAALIVLLVTALFHPAILTQYLIFGLLALAMIPVWWRVTRAWQHHDNGLNRRSAQYIGREFTLQTPVENGVGRLQIGDTLWLIMGENLPAGATIRITGARDNSLSFCHVCKD